MERSSFLLLILTVSLSAGRNLLTKSLSRFTLDERGFYMSQTLLFFSGALAVLPFALNGKFEPASVINALLYAALLVPAQWCYTAALAGSALSMCSTIYSMGFIIPTLFGVLVDSEKLGVAGRLGIAAAAATVLFAGLAKAQNTLSSTKKRPSIAIFAAMLASGGLGIVQKLQKNAENPPLFILCAFLFAGMFSLLFTIIKRGKLEDIRHSLTPAVSGGLCFGLANLINTLLAGRLSGALFFPIQNISVIIMSVFVNRLITKQKLKIREYITILLGAAAIILLSLR